MTSEEATTAWELWTLFMALLGIFSTRAYHELNKQTESSARLTIASYSRGAPGGKLKMTLGLPVYARSCDALRSISSTVTGKAVLSRKGADREQRCHHELRRQPWRAKPLHHRR